MSLADFSPLSLVLIATEFSLITFCVYRIIKHFRKGRLTGIQKKLSRSKITAYVLVALCFSIQLMSQLNGAFSFFSEGVFVQRILYLVCEVLPSILIISLALDLALFWQQLYSCFEEDSETMERKAALFQRYYVVVNILVYSLSVGLGAIYLLTEVTKYVIALLIMIQVALFISVVIFTVQAWRLYEKAKGMMGQFTISSKNRFIVLMATSLICYLMKAIFEISVIRNSWIVNDLDLSILYSLEDLGDFRWIEILYILGEFGTLLSFVLLLEVHTKHTKMSVTASTFVEDLEEYLHDKDDISPRMRGYAFA